MRTDYYKESIMEYYYTNGTVLIQQVEDIYVTVEVFPNNQTEQSFERAEFETIAKKETWLNNGITRYDLKTPADMSEQEQQELYNEVVNFCKQNMK